MSESLYDIARQVTDEVCGEGTYAKLNANHPDPGVQQAIAYADAAPTSAAEQAAYADWQHEVANGDTIRGFHEWLTWVLEAEANFGDGYTAPAWMAQMLSSEDVTMADDVSNAGDFFVEWCINIDLAEGPVDAARMCLDMLRDPSSTDMLRDPSSTAIVFFVTDDAGRQFKVDLEEDEPIPVLLNPTVG